MISIPVKSGKSKSRRGVGYPAERGHTGRLVRRAGLAAFTVLALAAAGCGSGGTPSTGGGTPAKGHAGGTYTILANSAFGVADPAQNYTLEEWQLLIDTHDGLVQFERVGGVAGTQILPHPATPIPAPTHGAQDHRFHIMARVQVSHG